MNWKSNLRNISIVVLLVFMAACAKNETATPIGDIQPSDTPGVDGTEVATEPAIKEKPSGTEAAGPTETPLSSDGGMPVAGAGLCANAYYPVREGATWTYQSTGGPVGGYGFTDTITSVREEGFTLTTQFDELTRTQDWACRTEGLVALQLGGTSAATLNSQDMQLTLDVSNVSGVTFPAEISAGDQWQHALEFTGKMVVASQEIEATGNAQTSFTAIGVESVTVPAGTFEAMKIRVDSTINITGIFQGVSLPITVSSPYDYWFVQGVGWVKASGEGDVGDESFTETIELQSYSIP
jgi:hypothetical protein